MILLISALVDVDAQPTEPSCDQTCPQVEWTRTVKTITPPPNCPGCTIKVVCYERDNTCYNPSRYEIYWEDWYAFPAECWTCLREQYTDYHQQFMTYWISYQLVTNNTKVNNLLPGQCTDDILVGLRSCYKEVFYEQGIGQPGSYWATEPCFDLACCLYFFKVCKDGQGNIVPFPPEMTGSVIPSFDCDEGCYPRCSQPPKIGIIVLDQKDYENYNIILSPNPLSDYLKVESDRPIDQEMTLEISDISSKIIFKAPFKLTNGSETLQITDVANSSYIFKIYESGTMKTIKTGTLIIQK